MFSANQIWKFLSVFLLCFHVLFSLHVFYHVHSSFKLQVHNLKDVSSASIMTCAQHCLSAHNCTSATFTSTERLCKLSNDPKNALEYVKTDQESSVVVMLPCLKQPSLCKNGGTCMAKENSLHGYECVCTEHWESQHCDVVKPRCYTPGFEYYEKVKTCYFPSTAQYTYHNGITQCQTLNASLAMGNSKEKIETIFSIVEREVSWFFLDLTHKDGKWSWGDGSTEYIWWRLPGEPSGDGLCVTTFPDGYRLNDAPCETPRKIMCEQEAIY